MYMHCQVYRAVRASHRYCSGYEGSAMGGIVDHTKLCYAL